MRSSKSKGPHFAGGDTTIKGIRSSLSQNLYRQWRPSHRGVAILVAVRLGKFGTGVFAIALLTGCNFSFGGKKIDSSKVETLIKTSLDKKLAGKLGGGTIAVQCPGDRPIKKGDVFECTVTAGTHTLKANVTQEDDKGTVAWEITDGIVALTIKGGTEDLIRQYIEKNLGVANVEVKCPDTIEVATGGTFECGAEIDGVKVTAGVEQQNDQGNVSYRLTRGVVLSEKLSIIVEAELKAQGVAAKIDCGAPIRLSKPGTNFECKAVDDQGVPAVVEVKINDDNGDVDWRINAGGATK